MRKKGPRADLDRSVKALVRHYPRAFLRLAGLEIAGDVRFGDVSVNLPELRADQVLVFHHEGAPVWALHLEYQLQPDARVLPDWFFKNAGLTRQLGVPVFLVVLYLTRGHRSSFPNAYRIAAGTLTNEYRFEAIRLWEHAGRIREGELAELAPLLVLCEDSPDEATLRNERDLIRRLNVSPGERADLLALALMIAARSFPREMLRAIFQEDYGMAKQSGLLDEWLDEREAETARRLALRLLRERFGEVGPAVVARVESATPAWCEDLAVRILRARSLEDLGL